MRLSSVFFISILIALLSFGNSQAQTPVANRVKAVVKFLPSSATVIAKYTDNERHCLYFHQNNRLYRYDVVSNKKTEVNFSPKSYGKILSAWISPDGRYIFIAIDRGSLVKSYPIDGQSLWRYDSKSLQSSLIGEGYYIEHNNDNIIIKKGTRCLNPNAPASKRKWMAQDHYYENDGRVLYTKDEYKVKKSIDR